MLIYVYRHEQYHGPYTKEEALERLKKGEFVAEDHARYKGGDEFTTLAALLGIEKAAPQPPAPAAKKSVQNRPVIYRPVATTRTSKFSPARLLIPVLLLVGALVGARIAAPERLHALLAALAGSPKSTPAPQATPAPKPIATPAPPVVAVVPVATPAPTPLPVATPPPFSPAKLAGNRAAWPKVVKLLQAETFPAVFNGQIVGDVDVPAGSDVNLVNIDGNNLTLDYRGGTCTVPWKLTNLEAAAANVPAPTPTPAMVAAVATPVPDNNASGNWMFGKSGSAANSAATGDAGEAFNSSVEGSALYGQLVRAHFQLTPEVKAAYLKYAKAQTLRQAMADDKRFPSDFLYWIDSDPIVQATVYGARKNAENVLLMLRSLDLDLGADSVRQNYTQLALAMAVEEAESGPSANITPRLPMSLQIPGDPRKPVNTKPIDRPLDVNDHIINFLEDHAPIEGDDFGGNKVPPQLKYDSHGVAIIAQDKVRKGETKLKRPVYAADVLESKPLQDEFNAYMKAHGQSVRIDCGDHVITPNSHDMIEGTYAPGIQDAFKLFRTAYEAKGRLPAERDAFATPAERCAYLIRNDTNFPADAGKHRWEHYPLKAPWPTMTLLAAAPEPLREREEVFRRFSDTGEAITYGEYIGSIAQQYDFQSARRLSPYPFTYGSYQMMMKDGGVCGTMANMGVRVDTALGTPACTAGQPGNCALIQYAFDKKTRLYRCEGGQYATGGDDDTHPHVKWPFGDTDENRDMVWHQSVAWGVNAGFQSYLDSMVALDIYKMLPDPEQKAHGLMLLESGLAVNRYNFALVEAAIANANPDETRDQFRQYFKGLFNGMDSPGRPIKGLYNVTVDKLLDKAAGINDQTASSAAGGTSG